MFTLHIELENKNVKQMVGEIHAVTKRCAQQNSRRNTENLRVPGIRKHKDVEFCHVSAKS